jgi:hypothetical protein
VHASIVILKCTTHTHTHTHTQYMTSLPEFLSCEAGKSAQVKNLRACIGVEERHGNAWATPSFNFRIDALALSFLLLLRHLGSAAIQWRMQLGKV